MICDYTAQFKIVGSDGVTVRGDLNDRDAGYTVEFYQEPDEDPREVTVESDYVDGDYATVTKDGPGTYVIVWRINAAWADLETAYQAARGWWRAESNFFLESNVEGVTKRWEARRPSVSPGPVESVNLARGRQTYTLRFRVQPNPTVTVA